MKKQLRRPFHRKLEVSIAGRWYLGLTVLLGVTAMTSGNNILYLLESFMLGGLILSGVLSEWAVSSIDLKWKRRAAISGGPCGDHIEIKNRRRLPFFCVEIGEWQGKKFKMRAFVPYLPPRGTLQVRVHQPYGQRGRYKWDAIGLATQFPFGFAKKLSRIELPGNRIVWPSPGLNTQTQPPHTSLQTHRSAVFEPKNQKSKVTTQSQGVSTFAEGEIRPINLYDDYRDVVWTLSAKRSEPVVRIRRMEKDSHFVTLNLRNATQENFESKIKEATAQFFTPTQRHLNEVPHLQEGVLILLLPTGDKKFAGAKASLDELALLESAQIQRVG